MKPTKKQLAESKYLSKISEIMQQPVIYRGKDQHKSKEIFYVITEKINFEALEKLLKFRNELKGKKALMLNIQPSLIVNKLQLTITVEL